MGTETLYRASLDDALWTEFDGISAVFDRNSGATHLIIPAQRHLLETAARQPLGRSALINALTGEFTFETNDNDSVRDTLAVRIDELIELGLLQSDSA